MERVGMVDDQGAAADGGRAGEVIGGADGQFAGAQLDNTGRTGNLAAAGESIIIVGRDDGERCRTKA